MAGGLLSLVLLVPPATPGAVGPGVAGSVTVGQMYWVPEGAGTDVSAFIGARLPSPAASRFAVGLGTGINAMWGRDVLARVTLGEMGLAWNGVYHEAAFGLQVTRFHGGRSLPGWTAALGIGWAPRRARGFLVGTRSTAGSYNPPEPCRSPGPSGQGDLPDLDDPCNAWSYRSGPLPSLTFEVFVGFVFI